LLDEGAEVEVIEGPPATPERASDGGRGEAWQVNIDSKNSGLLIGHFGETLNALQGVLRLVAGKLAGQPVSLVVDVAGYKANKAKELEELALQMAENVKNSGYAQTLRPMNSYERRVVHVVLKDFPGIEAVSTGEEPYRCIEIKPKK